MSIILFESEMPLAIVIPPWLSGLGDKVLLSGLSAEDKRETTSFMGSVDAKTRNALQVCDMKCSSSIFSQRTSKAIMLVYPIVSRVPSLNYTLLL